MRAAGVEALAVKAAAEALNRGDIILVLAIVIGVLVWGAIHHVDMMYKFMREQLAVQTATTSEISSSKELNREVKETLDEVKIMLRDR